MPQSAKTSEQFFSKPVHLNPDQALLELDRLDSQESLRAFAELAWPILEPQRPFAPGWHIDAICDHLEAVTKGQINRLLINVPPGCMKSLTTNVFWPAWEWGPRRRPDMRYVTFSYSRDLTVRDNRRTRTLIRAPWYQRLWGHQFQLADDQDAKTRFDTTASGFKIATSVGGLGVGERGDRVIIDDPHNLKDVESQIVRDETARWFLEIVPTRMSDPDSSAIVLIMQRTHEADVSGVILSRELDYVHLCLPMEFEPDKKCATTIGFSDPRVQENELLWPERMTRAVVERDKKVLGEYATAGQFQQRPAPRGGGMFKRNWWRFFRDPKKWTPTSRPQGSNEDRATDLPPQLDWVLLSCDSAFKATATGSRVSIIILGGRGPFRFVLDNVTRAMTFKETCDAILKVDGTGKAIDGLLSRWKCSKVLIEDKANGSALIDTLRTHVHGVIDINPEGGKESRASAIQPMVESGHVLLPEGAPWVDDFISEFATFPAGAHDDQVDALSQAIIHMGTNAAVSRAIALGTW